jgi:RecB family endonuclease NucS
LRERAHLQEWIAKYPLALGEELLVIQKEFAGFSDTQERLDLLALDKEGSLVIIEHKLDDTGRIATWQPLKYASYCARLTKEENPPKTRTTWTVRNRTRKPTIG